MLGTIRTVSDRTRERVLDGVDHLIKGLAAAHGAGAEVKLIRGYPVTVNDEGITGFATRVATELLGEERVRLMPTPIMGSEDFSYVLRQMPGTLMFLGTRPDGDAPPSPTTRTAWSSTSRPWPRVWPSTRRWPCASSTASAARTPHKPGSPAGPGHGRRGRPPELSWRLRSSSMNWLSKCPLRNRAARATGLTRGRGVE